jgi:hypothetical protein
MDNLLIFLLEAQLKLLKEAGESTKYLNKALV